jgi:hypothetical protein
MTNLFLLRLQATPLYRAIKCQRHEDVMKVAMFRHLPRYTRDFKVYCVGIH